MRPGNDDVPRFLRQTDLAERKISATHQSTQHLQATQGFPLGRLLGPNTRVWTTDEINAWLATRPVEVSEQSRRRAQRSVEARRASSGRRR